METTVVITPQTAKEQRTQVLMALEVGGQFYVPGTDRNKWTHIISSYVHVVSDRRFTVITDKTEAPAGKLIVRRIA